MPSNASALTKRLALLEQEAAAIREQLHLLSSDDRQQVPMPFRADKQILRQMMDSFFSEFNIEGTPIDPETLQARMAASGLKPNELSRDLIKARES